MRTIPAEIQEQIYINLFNTWKYEISVKELTRISNGDCFLDEIQGLGQFLKSMIKKEKDPIARLVYTKTLDNLLYMLNDLLDLRAEKIKKLTSQLEKIDENQLLPIEKEYYHSLRKAFKGYSKTKSYYIDAIEHYGDVYGVEEEKEEEHIQNKEEKSVIPVPQETRSQTKQRDIETHQENREIKKKEVPPSVYKDKDILSIFSLEEDFEEEIESELKKQDLGELEGSNKKIDEGKEAKVINKLEQRKNQTVIEKEPKDLSPPEKVEIIIEKPDKVEYVTLRTLTSIPAFVGEDLEIYGPFNKDELISVPLKNAEILLEEKLAKKISFHPSYS